MLRCDLPDSGGQHYMPREGLLALVEGWPEYSDHPVEDPLENEKLGCDSTRLQAGNILNSDRFD